MTFYFISHIKLFATTDANPLWMSGTTVYCHDSTNSVWHRLNLFWQKLFEILASNFFIFSHKSEMPIGLSSITFLLSITHQCLIGLRSGELTVISRESKFSASSTIDSPFELSDMVHCHVKKQNNHGSSWRWRVFLSKSLGTPLHW